MSPNILVVFLVATLARCSPVPGVKCDRLQETQHSFDLGPLTSCGVPPSGSALEDSCPKVDYAIPAVALQYNVFRLAAIQATMSDLNAILEFQPSNIKSACVQTFRNELCSFYFPRCSDDHPTVDVSFNRTRAREQCPSNLLSMVEFDGFAPNASSPYEGVYPIEPCKQKEHQVPLGICASYVDQILPSWLVVQVKAIEEDAVPVYNLLLPVDGQCAEMWLNYTCRSIGRCWSQGCRLERASSREQCSSLDSCLRRVLGPSEYNLISQTLGCASLPSESARPPTIATPITDPTTTPPMTTETTQGSDTNSPPVISIPTSASPPSLHSIAILVILTALFCCLLLL